MSDSAPPGNAVANVAPTARSVDAGRSVEWFKAGWNLFLKNPGVWIAISVIMLVVVFVLSMVPVIGQIAVLVTLPIAGGGLVLFAMAAGFAGGPAPGDPVITGWPCGAPTSRGARRGVCGQSGL